MKKITKSLLLIMTMVVMCFAVAMGANALEETGQCGENVYWEYDSTTRELVISGTGPMTDYFGESSPFCWSGVETVVIENGVTSIGDSAFASCYSLTSMTISDSVTSIGDSAFESCGSLTNITIPDSVTSIGNNAFYVTAYHYKSSNWVNNVLYIGNHLIEAKTSISDNYVIKDGTKCIADNAFYSCDSLTSITIPDSVTSIGDYAFYYCNSLTDVYYGGTEDNWKSVSIKGDYNEDLTDAIRHYCDVVNTATCTNNGVLKYDCTKCDDCIKIKETKALGHDMSDFTETLAPTCTEMGEERSNCSRCDYFETRDIIATGHDYETVVTKPTCIEKGYTTYTCHCSDTYIADEVAALGHEYRVTLDAPTCTKQGMKITYCINCTESTTETIPALDHTDKDENDYCDVCKEDLDPVAHCSCNCHKGGIAGFFFKLILFFQKLFRTNQVCTCGINHY